MVPDRDIIYPELSYSIMGCAMDVHNELGAGWDEWDYHRAMVQVLQSKGHDVVSHDRRELFHREAAVDHFELDVLVDDSVILELKHIRQGFHPEHYVQIINYLKHWDKRLGILINFGLERLASQRVPYDPVSGSVRYAGKWDELEKLNDPLCVSVVAALKAVLNRPGYGFGTRVFQNLLLRELIYRGEQALKPLHAPAYRGTKLEQREIDCIMLGQQMLLSVSATGKGSSADLACLKSYMKQIGIPYGILIDIGTPEILLKGVL